MRRPAAWAGTALLLVVAVGLGGRAAPSGEAGAVPPEAGGAPAPRARHQAAAAADRPRVQHPARFFDDRMFARARAAMPAARPAPGARAVVVPHHWLAGHLILSGIRDLVAGRQVDRVILIGPNHSGAGGAPVTTSEGSWATPFGVVEADAAAVRSLVDAGRAFANPDVLTYEHAIGGLVPALAALVPEARLVPLAVHGIREDEVRALASALARMMEEPGQTTVVVASVDFSHYLSAEEARARDPETLAAIRSLDSARLMSFRNEHLDSPGSMATVVEMMRLLGATRFDLRENAVSSEIAGHALDGATSYIHGFFSP